MMQKNNSTKHNKHQSIIFQIERIRHRTPKALAEEYFVFLSTLYGRKIESGDVRLRDYGNMTMFDVADEIKIRTKMLHADNMRKIEQHRAKRKKEQDNAIKELIQLQNK